MAWPGRPCCRNTLPDGCVSAYPRPIGRWDAPWSRHTQHGVLQRRQTFSVRLCLKGIYTTAYDNAMSWCWSRKPGEHLAEAKPCHVRQMSNTPRLLTTAANCMSSWNILSKYPGISHPLEHFSLPCSITLQGRNSAKPVTWTFSLEVFATRPQHTAICQVETSAFWQGFNGP